MIIPIRVEFFAGGLRSLITLALRSQNPKIFSFVNAITDTGSPNTILGSADMENSGNRCTFSPESPMDISERSDLINRNIHIQRMRISQVQMQKLLGEEKEVNLGGAQLKTRILPEAEFIIANKISIEIPVQVPVRIIQGNSLPVIIGIDFLLWRIRLFILRFILILQLENLKRKVTQLTKFSVSGNLRFFFYPSKKSIF